MSRNSSAGFFPLAAVIVTPLWADGFSRTKIRNRSPAICPAAPNSQSIKVPGLSKILATRILTLSDWWLYNATAPTSALKRTIWSFFLHFKSGFVRQRLLLADFLRSKRELMLTRELGWFDLVVDMHLCLCVHLRYYSIWQLDLLPSKLFVLCLDAHVFFAFAK